VRWHLDTDIVVSCLRGNLAVFEKIQANVPNIYIDAIVLAELLYGVHLSDHYEKNLRRLNEFLLLAHVIPFDEACSETYAVLRARLRAIGRTANDADLWIASVAMSRNSILVTHNLKHFEIIEGLELEDWLVMPGNPKD